LTSLTFGCPIYYHAFANYHGGHYESIDTIILVGEEDF